MDWRNIPSLSSLRAFETMSRCDGFSAAARELNVTHAAVSQQIRSLEEFFGRALVLRRGRNMELTDAGRELARSLHEGFQKIQEGVEMLVREETERPLKISVTPAFADIWLMPRLARFWQAHPDIALSLDTTKRVVDLREENVDLAIRYGKGDWDGVHCEKLTSAGFVVVAAKTLLEERAVDDLSSLANVPWLFEEGRPESRIWIESLGLNLENSVVKLFSESSLVMSATRSGYGVSVQPYALAEQDIKDGRLVQFAVQEENQLGYFLLRPTKTMSPNLKVFVNWLYCCG